MKKLLFALACLAAPFAFAASPAATQNWVRDYVATNTPSPSGGVTEDWVRDYVATFFQTNKTLTAASSDFSSNTVDGIINLFRLAGAKATVSATNDVYVTDSRVTGLANIILAPISTTVWTNAPKGVWLNATTNRFDFYDGDTVYWSTNLMNRSIALSCETNGVVFVSAAKVSSDKVREAKGE